MKGQVTLFVIIGLAVLLVAGIFIVVQQDDMSLDASQDAARITAFTQACMETTGEEVLRQIGENGGYLEAGAFKRTNSMRDTQVIDFAPQQLVLWHEIHPCENAGGCVSNNRPPLCEGRGCPVPKAKDTNPKAVSIEAQLERGIEAQVDKCLTYDVFPDLVVERTGKPQVDVVIREERITLSMEYPLTITTAGGEIVDVDEFAGELDIALPEIYRFAAEIQSNEAQYAFIEDLFLHLLSIYSGVDAELPPFRDAQLFGPKKTWVRSAVQQRIEQDILPFMNFVQIINAQESYVPIIDPNINDEYAPYADGVYQYMTVKTSDTVYPYGTTIEYPGTPIFLDINGKELLKPQEYGGGSFFEKLTGMFFTQYRFKYTAAFPVVVRIDDPQAFNGRGYTLAFALEANIRNNHPLNVTQAPLELTTGAPILDLSDPRQLVNHKYTLTVTDAVSNKPLPGAAVQYICDQRYYMGQTDAAGRWDGKLPYCIGGVLTLQQESYLGTGVAVVNVAEDGASSALAAKMWPLKEKRITVHKITQQDLAEIAAGVPRTDARSPLGENDSLILQMSRTKESMYEDDVPFAGVLSFGASATSVTSSTRDQLEEAHRQGIITDEEYEEALAVLAETPPQPPREVVTSQLVELAPGSYEVEGTLLHNGVIELGPNEKYKAEAKNFTSWVTGGVIFTGSDRIIFTEEEIYGDTDITMYVLEQPLPQTWDDLMAYQDISTYQTYDRRTAVKPEVTPTG